MNSEGPYSYAHNSSSQKIGIDQAMTIIADEIMENLDLVNLLSTSNQVGVADLGCSIGPNTFHVVESIMEAMELRFRAGGLSSGNLEFQVFFNDQMENDFNTLFRSLPPHRLYYAAGVPGSFHGRLFPKASLHFVHSSFALHWLSRVPKEVCEPGSAVWNKGKIIYRSKEVEAAYRAQFMEDMESFLAARAEELVQGGLMALLYQGGPNGVDPLKCRSVIVNHLLGSTLMDMAKMGLIDEAKVDSFNMPLYFASPQQMERAIQKNGSFTVMRLEQLAGHGVVEPKIVAQGGRAISEKILTQWFGREVIDELFDRFLKKMIETKVFEDVNYVNDTPVLVILQRK